MARGIRFLSFDLTEPEFGGDWFRQDDILLHSSAILSEFMHPMMLWCDNGNKPLEVEIYSPHLQKGDVLAVHDWGKEIFPKDIPPGFHPIATGKMTAIFERA
jgi:hypothetical protein